MTGDDLGRLMTALGYSVGTERTKLPLLPKGAFADLIGISGKSLANYLDGSAPIPKTVALACAAVKRGLPPL